MARGTARTTRKKAPKVAPAEKTAAPKSVAPKNRPPAKTEGDSGWTAGDFKACWRGTGMTYARFAAATGFHENHLKNVARGKRKVTPKLRLVAEAVAAQHRTGPGPEPVPSAAPDPETVGAALLAAAESYAAWRLVAALSRHAGVEAFASEESNRAADRIKSFADGLPASEAALDKVTLLTEAANRVTRKLILAVPRQGYDEPEEASAEPPPGAEQAPRAEPPSSARKETAAASQAPSPPPTRQRPPPPPRRVPKGARQDIKGAPIYYDVYEARVALNRRIDSIMRSLSPEDHQKDILPRLTERQRQAVARGEVVSVTSHMKFDGVRAYKHMPGYSGSVAYGWVVVPRTRQEYDEMKRRALDEEVAPQKPKKPKPAPADTQPAPAPAAQSGKPPRTARGNPLAGRLTTIKGYPVIPDLHQLSVSLGRPLESILLVLRPEDPAKIRARLSDKQKAKLQSGELVFAESSTAFDGNHVYRGILGGSGPRTVEQAFFVPPRTEDELEEMKRGALAKRGAPAKARKPG